MRAQYRAGALEHDQPLSQLTSSTTSSAWHTIAEAKGALLLDALRRKMGEDAFYALMRAFFDENTTKSVHSSAFIAAAGADRQPLFSQWLDGTGLPDTPDGPIYTASALRSRLGSAIIVYGTLAEAGANRYAAEQWQKQFLNQFESAVRIAKDFEVSSEDLRARDVVFIGRPETNSALAAWAKSIALDYDGAVFHAGKKDHPSENEALIWTAANPEDRAHMVVVAAGNSPLSTVLLSRGMLGGYQYEIADSGKSAESGFSK